MVFCTINVINTLLKYVAPSLPHGNRQQSKTLILSRTLDRKVYRNRVFDCNLSPNWRQMAIKNTVSSNFYLHSSIVKSVFDSHLCGVIIPSLGEKKILKKTTSQLCYMYSSKFQTYQNIFITGKTLHEIDTPFIKTVIISSYLFSNDVIIWLAFYTYFSHLIY